MEVEFWKQRWLENQIGFHLNQVNPRLIKYWSKIGSGKGNHVLVPLCGKSLDLLWLEKAGFVVTGIECSQLAIESFIAEHNLPHKLEQGLHMPVYQAGNIRLLQGDYFALQREMFASIDAVYDRAALIALPADMRESYVSKMFELLSDQTAILLITLEYDQTAMSGPPFSVPESEVHKLYNQRFNIIKLEQKDVLQDQPRFAQRGLRALLETVYLLQPK